MSTSISLHELQMHMHLNEVDTEIRSRLLDIQLNNLVEFAVCCHERNIPASAMLGFRSPRHTKGAKRDDFFDLFVSRLGAAVSFAKATPGLLPAVISSQDQSDIQLAIPILIELIRTTKGDVGGHDQCNLYAEIALDFVKALRLRSGT